jgi:periplasmic protein TonB
VSNLFIKEGNMFRETLLESAPASRKRKGWPMAMAFTAELVAATLLVVLPLLSTGVITVSAHAPIVTSLGRPDLHRPTPHPPSGHGISVPSVTIVPITTCCARFTYRDQVSDSFPEPNEHTGPPNIGYTGFGVANLPFSGTAAPPPPPRHIGPVRRSRISEGELVNRVDPVYPRVAVLTGTQGEVRLHAIIAKDGSIQSLNVVSGHPLLVRAAVDAVRQWRYRPYYLNGDAVEVETFITVNFKKTNE